MKHLVIVTGMPGSGKTSIAKYLNTCFYNSTLISLDQLKENIYDLIGFHNRKEKTSIRRLSYNIFSMLLEECMTRGDNVIIVEYPFDDTWYNLFNNLQEKYKYNIITLQILCSDINLNYHRMVDRDRNSNRHVAQCLKEYYPLYKNTYINIEKWNYDYFKQFHDSFTFLNIGQVIQIDNINKSVDQLLKLALTSVHSIINL